MVDSGESDRRAAGAPDVEKTGATGPEASRGELAEPWRLAIVASHPIQYQVPLYRRLARREDLELTVLYCSDLGRRLFSDWEMGVDVAWDVDLEGGYRHRFLWNLGFGKRWTRHINPSLPGHLLSGHFDAVVFQTGWGSISAFIGFSACKLFRIPIFIFGDSAFVTPDRGWKGRVRAAILRALFRQIDRFLVTGTLNGSFYRHYGASSSRFSFTPFAVDNERFQSAARDLERERDSWRAARGIAREDVVLLFTGKLSVRKNPRQLLEAYVQARSDTPLWLLFAGDGGERQALEQRVRELNLDRVLFFGFVNQTELPRLYTVADLFVLPSSFDPRGLVINEAMASGLPCIVSDRVGASADLVEDGVTGRVYPHERTDRLTEAISDLAANRSLRKRMSLAATERMKSWSYDQEIEGIMTALRLQGEEEVEEDRRS